MFFPLVRAIVDSVVSVAIKRIGNNSATAAELGFVAEVLADAGTFLPLDDKLKQAREDVGCALAERAAVENVLLLGGGRDGDARRHRAGI